MCYAQSDWNRVYSHMATLFFTETVSDSNAMNSGLNRDRIIKIRYRYSKKSAKILNCSCVQKTTTLKLKLFQIGDGMEIFSLWSNILSIIFSSFYFNYLDLDLESECSGSTSITSSLSLDFRLALIFRLFCAVWVTAAQIDVDVVAMTNFTESLLSL